MKLLRLICFQSKSPAKKTIIPVHRTNILRCVVERIYRLLLPVNLNLVGDFCGVWHWTTFTFPALALSFCLSLGFGEKNFDENKRKSVLTLIDSHHSFSMYHSSSSHS